MTASGIPWREIDFAADIERANAEGLPRIWTAENSRATILIRRDMHRGVVQGL